MRRSRSGSPTTAAGSTRGAPSGSPAVCGSSASRPTWSRAAVGEQDREDELEAAVALLRRRVPGVPATPRERDRALGMLVRKGYGLELAYDALRRYAGVDEPLD